MKIPILRMKALQPKRKNSSLKIKDTYISIKVELHKYLKLNSELQKNGIIVNKLFLSIKNFPTLDCLDYNIKNILNSILISYTQLVQKYKSNFFSNQNSKNAFIHKCNKSM